MESNEQKKNTTLQKVYAATKERSRKEKLNVKFFGIKTVRVGLKGVQLYERVSR